MTGRRRKGPLTRAAVLDAALGIVDSEGLAALTMRRLADAVGVEAMSLYYHVPSKEVLLDWTVERMRAEMQIPDTPPGDWMAALEAIFVEYQRVLAAHPNMLPVSTRRTAAAEASGLQYLIGQGFAPDDAVELYQSLVALTVGYSMAGSPLVERSWAGLPEALTERMRDWRADTFRRTIRIVMEGYAVGAGGGRR